MKRTSGGLSGDSGAARGAQKRGNYGTKNIRAPADVYAAGALEADPAFGAGAALLVTVGMADTVMVSTVGEAAVSGISLVDQVNVLLIQIFAALATGGAVVASQYLGRRDRENACRSAKQLVYATFGMAVAIGAGAGAQPAHPSTGVRQCGAGRNAGRRDIFLAFGAVIPDAGAVQRGGRWFRSMGNSRISLFASLIMNVINIGGNALLIYGLNWGVAGAATATLASRTVAGLMMMLLLRNQDNPIFSGAPVPPGMERRHPQKASCAWACQTGWKTACSRSVSYWWRGSSPPSARRLSRPMPSATMSVLCPTFPARPSAWR